MDNNLMKILESLMERVLSIETKMGESGGTGKEMAKTVKNTMEQWEGRIEERIGKGLDLEICGSDTKHTKTGTSNDERNH